MKVARALKRLRSITRDEAIWRTRQAARTGWKRAATRLARPAWDRGDLRKALADGVIDYMFRSGSGASCADMHIELSAQLQDRHSRFALDPTTRDVLRERVDALWPSAAADAAERAERRIARHHDLLGYRDLDFTDTDGGIAWHRDPVHGRTAPLGFWADVPYLDPAVGDHKVIWELNRHQHWLQLGRAYWLTGNTKYRDAIVGELHTWLAANPPLMGINWASMLELGFRSLSWVWAMHFLLADKSPIVHRNSADDSPWLVDLFIGLHHQLTHIEQNLSIYFSPNTHLTGEALALYVAGVALPELAGSPRWAETGRSILLSEMTRQIGRDGGHAERSTHYQRYTLDFYLLALQTARRDGDTEAAAAFARACLRLADFTRSLADQEGRLPTIGDDDGGMLWPIAGRACNDVRDSLALAAVLLEKPDLAPWGLQEEVLWIAGLAAVEQSPPLTPSPDAAHLESRTFPHTGYIVVRDQFDTHAVIDVGPHGYQNCGHAHADALALTLKLDGRPLLIDPGTFTYTMDARLRDHMRSSLSHNTVSLQGRSFAEPAGPFHWATRADATLHAVRHNDAFDWIEAWHDASPGVRHRRTIFRSAGLGWIIADEILGEGPITASAHWHFDPAWAVAYEDAHAIRATHEDGTTLWLLHEADGILLTHGDVDSGLGWYAPVYGTRRPTWTVRTTRNAAGPFSMTAWLGSADDSRTPAFERIAVVPHERPGPLAIRLRAGAKNGLFLFRTGVADADALADCVTGDYESNARTLHYSHDTDRLRAIVMVDASHALTARDGWISITCSHRLPDLSATFTGATLRIHSSTPAGEIRLHGRALRGVTHVTVNGREMPRSDAEPSDTLLITSPDWGPAAHGLLPGQSEARQMDVFAL